MGAPGAGIPAGAYAGGAAMGGASAYTGGAAMGGGAPGAIIPGTGGGAIGGISGISPFLRLGGFSFFGGFSLATLTGFSLGARGGFSFLGFLPLPSSGAGIGLPNSS